MRETTLVLPMELRAQLDAVAGNELETAGVLLVGTATADDGEIRLMGREYHPAPNQSYVEQKSDELLLNPDAYVGALARAAELGAVAVWVHSHPYLGSSVQPSEKDRLVDEGLRQTFQIRSGREAYGTLILGIAQHGLTFTGQIEHDDHSRPISRIWSIGDRCELLRAQSTHRLSGDEPDTALFDRNIRAFGGRVQAVLGDLRVAVVGCGGTGSAVAEQLVRLGVRHLKLIDPDELSYSNLTRVYGSTPSDVGQSKVNLLSEHLAQIAPNLNLSTLQSTVTNKRGARFLIGCDVVFGCTDDNAGRLVLSRLASYLATPVIDCGVLLASDEADNLTDIVGRVTTLAPGCACLVCRNRIDMRRAQAEALTPDERRRLSDEGYAAALPGIEPAVVTFTTAVASAAVAELLERLIGYGPVPVPSEVLLRFHEREMSSNVVAPRSGHYCDPATRKIGIGDTEPFLEQTWTD